MSQSQVCYVCRTSSSNYLKNARHIFGDFASAPSERQLSDVLGEILEKDVIENTTDSNLLCIKCANTVMEYDLLQSKVKTLKTKLQLEWVKGQNVKNPVTVTISPTKQSPLKKDIKKVVLPASKLQPLPANFVLNMQNIQNTPKFVKISPSPQTKTTTITTQPTPQTNLTNISNKVIAAAIKYNSAQNLPKTTDSLMTLNLESLPKDFMASLNKLEQKDDGNENDEMEIDEECTVTVVPISNSSDVTTADFDKSFDNDNDIDKQNEQDGTENDKDGHEVMFSEFNVEGEGSDNEQHTLVVEGTTSDALLRLMVGQKLMYGDKQISLVMDQNDDDQESIDDIELRVSGDEETANAIIAAQEQGSSFIKLENGELFEVKCVQSKPNEESLENDILSIIQKEDDGSFTCLLCPKSDDTQQFKSRAEAMTQHLKNEHSAKLYICSICGYVVRKRTEFNTHFDIHLKNSVNIDKSTSKYECEQCNKKFVSKSLLMNHSLVHAGLKPHVCKTCQKSFASKYTLQAHMKIHTSRPRPFQCAQCSKSFMTPQNLAQHQKTHSTLRNFICRVCNKAFASQHALEVHGVVHSGERRFVCDMCSKGFARKQELADHIRVHTGERPFSCSECGASFAQRSNLHSHKRHTHTDDRRHACQHCSKRFKRRRLLEYHIKSRHTGERPLNCVDCGATFVYPEHYRKHKMVHSGEKPYVCEICGKSFNSRDNRNTHRFVHSDKKPYECVVCAAGYMRKHALYQHMHATGHLAETIVVNQPRVENATDKLILEGSIEDNNSDSYETNEVNVDDEDKGQDIELLAYNIDTETIKGENLLEETTDINTEETQSWEDGMIRIVEIQLPNGNNGWVAINP